eukprot:8772717-Pyramimonas_sp.AAC.1
MEDINKRTVTLLELPRQIDEVDLGVNAGYIFDVGCLSFRGLSLRDRPLFRPGLGLHDVRVCPHVLVLLSACLMFYADVI